MKKILFVDDEQRILDSLKRMLRYTLKDCEILFAQSGQEALELVRNAPFDVVVSDMLMAGMNGAELLAKIKDLSPDTIRVILSGYSELEITLQTVRVAHQYLTKPCDPKIISNVIERAFNLRDMLNVPSLRAVINGMDNIPSLPRIYEELNQALCDPNISLEDITGIVEQDMGMCAKILQVVNSAFFGFAKRVTDVQTAIASLGVNMIKTLSLSIDVFRSIDVEKFPVNFPFKNEQNRILLAAHLSRHFFEDKPSKEDVYMAALLQDIGQMILAENFPERYEKILQTIAEKGGLLQDLEKMTFGVGHAEVGAYLLGVWGLPYSIVEAVAYHHEPHKIRREGFDVLSGVCVANMLSYGELTRHVAREELLPYQPLDRQFLQSLETSESVLASWKEIARLLAEKQLAGPYAKASSRARDLPAAKR